MCKQSHIYTDTDTDTDMCLIVLFNRQHQHTFFFVMMHRKELFKVCAHREKREEFHLTTNPNPNPNCKP